MAGEAERPSAMTNYNCSGVTSITANGLGIGRLEKPGGTRSARCTETFSLGSQIGSTCETRRFAEWTMPCRKMPIGGAAALFRLTETTVPKPFPSRNTGEGDTHFQTNAPFESGMASGRLSSLKAG